MSDQSPSMDDIKISSRKPVGTLIDFVDNIGKNENFDIEVAIKEGGHVILFHSHPFKKELGWFEFNLTTKKLNFVLEDGEQRDSGLPLYDNVAAHMQNAHQILTVQMDPKTGDAVVGNYIPLILHSD